MKSSQPTVHQFLNTIPDTRPVELTSLAAVNAAAARWRDEVANLRLHGQTRQSPDAQFAVERPQLKPLPPTLYDVSLVRSVPATRRFRVQFDGNSYSVPAEYAGTRLGLHADPTQLRLYHRDRLIAEHPRCYDRGRDIENPDHPRALLAQRRRARTQHLLQQFLQLSPLAETYHAELQRRRLNPTAHVHKIVALADIYGADAVARALADASEFAAYSSEYIANLLEARQRQLPAAGALHLTRAQDLLELDLPAANLNLYQPSTPKENHPDETR